MSFQSSKEAFRPAGVVMYSNGLLRHMRAAQGCVERARATHQMKRHFSVAEQRFLIQKLLQSSQNGKSVSINPNEAGAILEAYAATNSERDMYASIAMTDPLTGVANRNALDVAMDREFARLEAHDGKKRNPDAEILFLYIDLDGFKAINDKLGHAAGDKMLQDFVSRMGSVLRKTDLLARTGGDEFFCLMPFNTSDEPLPSPEMLRARVDKAMEGLVLWDGDAPYPLGASLGISTSIDDLRGFEAKTTKDSMMKLADHNMYLDKHGPDPDNTPAASFPKNQRLESLRQAAVRIKPQADCVME